MTPVELLAPPQLLSPPCGQGGPQGGARQTCVLVATYAGCPYRPPLDRTFRLARARMWATLLLFDFPVRAGFKGGTVGTGTTRQL